MTLPSRHTLRPEDMRKPLAIAPPTRDGVSSALEEVPHRAPEGGVLQMIL